MQLVYKPGERDTRRKTTKNTVDVTQGHEIRQFIRAVCQMFHIKEIFTEKEYSPPPYFQPSTYWSFTTRLHKQPIKLLNIAQALHHIRRYKFSPFFQGKKYTFVAILMTQGSRDWSVFCFISFFYILPRYNSFFSFDLLFLSTCFLFVPFSSFGIFWVLGTLVRDKRLMEKGDRGFWSRFR